MKMILFLAVSLVSFILLILSQSLGKNFTPDQHLRRGQGYLYAMLMLVSLMLGFFIVDDLLSYQDTLLCLLFSSVTVFLNYCIWVDAYYPAGKQPKSIWRDCLLNGFLILLCQLTPLDPFFKWIQVLFWGSQLISHLGKYYWDKRKGKDGIV